MKEQQQLKTKPSKLDLSVASEYLECAHCKKRGVVPLDRSPASVPPKGIVLFEGRPEEIFKPLRMIVSGDVGSDHDPKIIVLDAAVGSLSQFATPVPASYFSASRGESSRFDTVQICQQVRVYLKNQTDAPIVCEVWFEGETIDYR